MEENPGRKKKEKNIDLISQKSLKKLTVFKKNPTSVLLDSFSFVLYLPYFLREQL